MARKIRSLSLLIYLLLFTTLSSGCWDVWEIEERGLVLAIGIDRAPHEEVANKSGVEGQLLEDVTDKGLKVTYQFAIPAGLAGEEAGGGPTYYNLTTTALSSELLVRGLASTRSSRKGDLIHLQVLILGPEIVKDNIYSVLERLVRDPDVRKQVSVYVTEGDVAELLDISTKQEPMPAIYLSSLIANEDWAHRIAPEMRLGKVYRHIREEGVYIIPRITPGEEDAKLAGGGIFHKNKLVGWLGEEEIVAFRWLTNEMETVPVIISSALEGEENLIDGYLAERSKTIIHPRIEGDKLKFHITVKTEGDLLERQIKGPPLDGKNIKKLEKEFARVLVRDLETIIKKAQEELRLDIFGFGRFVERVHPRVWKEIQDDWHEIYFPEAEIEIDMDLTVSRTGILK